MVSIQLNGEREEVASETIQALIAELGIKVKFLIVERNGEAVCRDAYAKTPVQEGDRLEIVQPMSGG